MSPLLFNIAFEYAVRRVQVNQEGLKVNDTLQRLVYADDINILNRSVHTTKNTEALLVSSKEMGLEVNADKTVYMVRFRNQKANQNHNINLIINPMEGCISLGI